MDVYKISSSDITNKPFIEFLCQFKKPLILSTGASNLDEITDALDWIKPFNLDVALLHCILNYPTNEKNANLGMIKDLQNKFPNNLIGYSDHTLPLDMKTLEIATILGCRIIEKHFTHDKLLEGNDHYHAMDKNDLKRYFELNKRIELITGGKNKKSIESENISRLNARRSLVINQNIKKNTILSLNHLTWKRPANGISPREIDKIIGKKTIKDINEDEILRWEMIEN